MSGILQIRLACSLSERLRGLLDNDVCPTGEVLALFPCKSIHTFGMRGAIDVAFIDGRARVLKAVCQVPPGRLLSCRNAVGTLERRSVEDTPWLKAGDTLNCLYY